MVKEPLLKRRYIVYVKVELVRFWTVYLPFMADSKNTFFGFLVYSLIFFISLKYELVFFSIKNGCFFSCK